MQCSDLIQGLVRVTEAARFLAISRSKIYGLMDSGQLPYVKLGRSRRIPRQALIELAREHLIRDCSETSHLQPGGEP
jgi:excisionase family DNA binding protein